MPAPEPVFAVGDRVVVRGVFLGEPVLPLTGRILDFPDSIAPMAIVLLDWGWWFERRPRFSQTTTVHPDDMVLWDPLRNEGEMDPLEQPFYDCKILYDLPTNHVQITVIDIPEDEFNLIPGGREPGSGTKILNHEVRVILRRATGGSS